jgi:hypothetical protein
MMSFLTVPKAALAMIPVSCWRSNPILKSTSPPRSDPLSLPPPDRVGNIPACSSDGHDPTSTDVEVVDLGRNSRIGRELEGIKL